jgi:hypothetical protein
VAALVVGAATATAADASGTPVAALHWHVVEKVKTDGSGDFTAVVATGKTTGWAFDGYAATKGPAAWERKGSTWTRVAFPGKANEVVAAAAATSPSDVWAFDNNIFGTGSRVVRWNGHAWSAVKTFAAAISGVSVLAGNDVWVFGYPPAPLTSVLGAWHYNGHAWSRVSKTLQGGSALAPNSVWAYNGTSVYHWNGSKWAGTSVKSLLPAALKSRLNHPAVTGILALSGTSVYAVGNGNLQDEGGPTVVLHFNGHKWSRVATGGFGYGAGQQLSADGRGVLWLPMPGVGGQPSAVVRYAAGKLTRTALPVAATKINVGSIARIPGTADQIAGGFTHASGDYGASVVAVILQYG